MYVTKLLLKNYGPISHVEISPRFDTEGKPVPLVLLGQNGSGKTLAIASILDALVEARRRSFTKIPDVHEDDYFKRSSKLYIGGNLPYSRVTIEISDQIDRIYYDEIVCTAEVDRLDEKTKEEIGPAALQNQLFMSDGFYKNCTLTAGSTRKIIGLPILYFPPFRDEIAAWTNEVQSTSFAIPSRSVNIAPYSPIRRNITTDLKTWILDLVLDRQIYEMKFTPIPFMSGLNSQIEPRFDGPNSTALEILNKILLTIFSAKDPSITSARLGVGNKGNRTISIYVGKNCAPNQLAAHDLTQLSSGEIFIFGLAAEIVRCCEMSTHKLSANLNELKAIVLIDEIDLHMHIRFQKNALPQVLKLFPGIQFVVTTHSPFFVAGMEESREIELVELPSGAKIHSSEFSEFKHAYDIFFENDAQYSKRFSDLKAEIARSQVPLVITEGKTDWRHLKSALTHLENEFPALSVQFFEFDDEFKMGDSKLQQMCETFAAMKQPKKTIFLFDRDNQKIIEEMADDKTGFRSWGGNVYSMCLPIPAHRLLHKNISIEMLYTDNDLKTSDPKVGKRLYFNNEIEERRNTASGKKYFGIVAPDPSTELVKKPFDGEAGLILDEEKNSVGLSKAAFASQIAGDAQVSAHFDRSAFRAVFEALTAIIETP